MVNEGRPCILAAWAAKAVPPDILLKGKEWGDRDHITRESMYVCKIMKVTIKAKNLDTGSQ